MSVSAMRNEHLSRHTGVVRALLDAAAVAQRNLIALTRVPQYLVFSTIQPVIFVLMFRYVFGGAIDTGDTRYVDFLMPGIFVQTATFGALGTGVGLATDLKSGLLERFRSLPMARSAVLAGRTAADFIRNIFVAVLMTIVGFAVGFRYHDGLPAFLAAIGLMLIYGYTLSWMFAMMGLTAGDPETAQAASFPLMAPLVFASSAFVPVSSMPSWLQGFAGHQPVSATTSAMRALVLGEPVGEWLWLALAWDVGLLLLFVPMAVAKYRRSV